MDRLKVKVRPISEDEIDILESRLRRYTTETHRDRFEEQQRGETTYLVAWYGAEPAGYARVKWQPGFMMGLVLRNTPTIGDVTVREDLRSKGVGSQIMKAAEDLARARGLSRLALGVEVDNALAIDFYHRRGYFDAGIPPDRSGRYLLGEGELWHQGDMCICLVKDLNPGPAALAVARAKINLAHRVGPRRRDGFHSVSTVLGSITLADEITFRPGRAVSITSAAGLQDDLPETPDLVETTLKFGARRSARAKGMGASVVKRIPLGAGMGGGSADAAAALLFLHTRDPSAFPRDVLVKKARRLGADVPFSLSGGLAAGSGRGDRLHPLHSRRRLWWVVGVPNFRLSTKEVYRRYDASFSPEAGTRPAGVTPLEKALAAGDLSAIAANLLNDLEGPAFEMRPELQSLKNSMIASGAHGAVMTGSGSAIIGLCETEGEAAKVAQKARRYFSRVEVTASTAAGAEMVAT